MTTLTVWKFNDADGAEAAIEKLDDLEKRQLITVLDSAVVTWPAGKRHPKTRQRFSPTAAGAADGAFWGLLFGILFFVPIIGLAVGHQPHVGSRRRPEADLRCSLNHTH